MVTRTLALLMALGLGTVEALAAEPLRVEEAQEAALEASAALVGAELRTQAAEEGIRGAIGGFDPLLSLNGGWNRDRNRTFFPGFPDPFFSDSDSWDVGATLSASAPTGTTASVSTRFASTHTSIRAEPGSSVGSFLDDFEQLSFRPNFSLSLSQDLLRGVKMSFNLQNVRRARDQLTMSELELERARQQTLADVSRAYWTWSHLEAVAVISRDAVGVAEENLRVGTARVESGEAAPLERTRLEAAMVQARTTAIEAENEGASARDSLLVLMGHNPGELIVPASKPGQVPTLELEASRAIDVALSQSVDLALARHRVDMAKADLSRARHAILPSLTASLDAGLSGFDDASWAGAFALGETLLPTIGVRGAFSVPLGNRAATSNARVLSMELRQRQVELAGSISSMRADVERAVRVLTSAALKVELADVNQRLAKETLAAEEALYDAGRTLLKDVLESRSSLDRARTEAVRARTDFRIAEVELLRLQGRLGR